MAHQLRALAVLAENSHSDSQLSIASVPEHTIQRCVRAKLIHIKSIKQTNGKRVIQKEGIKCLYFHSCLYDSISAESLSGSTPQASA